MPGGFGGICGLGGLDGQGSMTGMLSDGVDLAVYADKDGNGSVFTWGLVPPYQSVTLSDEDLGVDLTRRGVKSRRGILVSSNPLTVSGIDEEHVRPWTQLAPGHLQILRQGTVRAEAGPLATVLAGNTPPAPAPEPAADVRTFHVAHRTVYRYETAVERSAHLLRLVPVHDHLQTLVSHELSVTLDGRPLVDGRQREYEDVFGNRARRLQLETPYRELAIEARSVVTPLDTDPLAFRPLRARSTIPLVWMPWQRQILQPFLLPPELPESELIELVDYAMSFVKRNDSDLLQTLLDMNASIHRDYEYRQGATTVLTTPFEVYANRRGVCQDFTNLFICMARLLGVPARYVCGYLYTGPKHENRAQAEASHAWAQVYLPEVGWKGFDPTNGVLTRTDHVRVAVGRNYVDATPTSGTIFVGGGPETLEVSVEVSSHETLVP